jgi:predicted metal-binding membrane protein
MTVAAPTVRRLPRAVPAAIGLAWGVAVVAELTGHAKDVHHGALIEGGHLPMWAALGLFTLAWQLMIAAMMLPSSLPMVQGFRTVTGDQRRSGSLLTAFLGGYASVWTLFGAVAFIGDIFVHRAVDAWPWLHAHPWLIAGGTLVVAGSFQLSSLKDRCLSQCRNPGAFLLRYYRRGERSAFALGLRHGIFCVGCCWALMLVMFGAGVANLWWMAALTALMTYEKAAASGDRAVPVAGAVLLLAGLLVLAHPSWLPPLFAGDV